LKTWDVAQAAELWGLARPVPGALPAQNNVYVHVPFCKSICRFCNYERLQLSSPAWLRAYLDRLLASLDVLAPAVAHLEFHALYVGGGTPSTLPARMLQELFTKLDEKLRWHPHASREFEFDPTVMSAERLDVLKAHGVGRYSFGIQTLDPAVNEAHDRGRQGIEIIERRFRELAERGLDAVSCDFLLGLSGTTAQGVFAEIGTVLRRFRPHWIDVYLVTPTQSYVDAHFGGSYDNFWAHLRPFQDQSSQALTELAETHGYRLLTGSGHRMSLIRPEAPRSNTARYSYSQLVSEQRRPLNLLGLGPSARTQIFGVAQLQTRDPGDTPDVPGPASYEGHRVDLDDEVRTYLVHHFRDQDSLDRRHFQDVFGEDVVALAPRAVAAWQAEGLLELSDEALCLKTQDRLSRTCSLVWLVPEVALEYELARRMGLDLSAQGVARLLSPVPPGQALAGGVRYMGARAGRILLRANAQSCSIRIAPPLTDSGEIRLVVDQVPAELVPIVRQAVRQLTALARRNHAQIRAQQDAERALGVRRP
jgi:coproporphyrinogen III oxidase-like Fe-S oxidoreductase